MKFILISLFIIWSSIVFAEKKDDTTNTDPTGLELDSKAKPNKQVFEYGYSYISFGQGIITTKDFTDKGSQITAGYTRIAEELLYGINYNRIESSNKIVADGFNMNVGFISTKVAKVKPSASLDFGFATVQNKETSIKSSGIYSGFNLGIQLSEVLPFHFITGLKLGSYNMNDKNNVKAESLYFTLGFEF
jgi:hypothetical protein